VRAQNQASFSVFAPAEKRLPPATPGTSPSIAPADRGQVGRLYSKEKPPLGRIDINTATERELRSVPGIGPVMAARIIAARPFRSADDLKKVNGIGDKKLRQDPAVFSVIPHASHESGVKPPNSKALRTKFSRHVRVIRGPKSSAATE
jgi:competence ComEA-like helix-hairpin-helix protein